MVKLAESFPPPSDLVDLRETAAQSHHGYATHEREWSDVTGICLHQTACLLGTRPTRWSGVGAHLGIMRSGCVVWLHDFNRYVIHGNGWNAKTVGIEIDGLYAGVEGDPDTVWNDPDTPQREQGMVLPQAAIDAALETIRWICSRVQEHGGEIKVLVAHRQSSKDRRNDPGSAIWKSIALPMHAELGLSDGGVGFKIGGYPIPESWDPRCEGIGY